MQSNHRKSEWTCCKNPLLVLVALAFLPCLCCSLFYPYVLEELYLFLVGDYYYDRAMDKVPEFDRLNDELVTELPKYPGVETIPEGEWRGGPDREEFLPAPTWPRTLEVCYQVDATMDQVLTFYKRKLQKDSWKLIRDERWLGARNWHAESWFSRGQACVIVATDCWRAGKKRTDQPGTAVYQVWVFYELNKLLGFPGIPRKTCQD